jgi:hypothetical protein
VGVPTQFGLVNPLLNTFARLDYQISAGNRLVVRNIYNDQKQDDFGRSTGTFNFTSNFFRRRERSNQVVAQLFSNLPAGMSNEAIVGYTATRFKRNPSVLQPQYVVQNIGGAGTGLNFRGGTENSSQGNELRENLFEFQDNLTIPRGAHNITVGTRNEVYKVYNAFLQNSFGNYTFASLADWVSGARATQYSGSGSLGGPVAAEFSAAQLGGYLQDQWTVNPRLTVTGGVRVDVPVFFDKPPANDSVRANFGRDASAFPSGKVQFSPRLGFNLDVTGNQVNQLRGGVGLFQGAPAYVWLSNQYQNSGSGLAQITCGVGNLNGGAPDFSAQPVAPTACSNRVGLSGNNAALNGTPGVALNPTTFSGTVNLADPNLRFPQLLRADARLRPPACPATSSPPSTRSTRRASTASSTPTSTCRPTPTRASTRRGAGCTAPSAPTACRRCSRGSPATARTSSTWTTRARTTRTASPGSSRSASPARSRARWRTRTAAPTR